MKKINLITLFLIHLIGFSQKNSIEFKKARELLELNKIEVAYEKFKKLETKILKKDTLYNYNLWSKIQTGKHLEKTNRLNEKFDKSLKIGLETLKDIEKGAKLFNNFNAEKNYMIKNITVSYYGLRNYNQGSVWKNKLYKAKKENQLPEGLDKYFNFDFFKYKDKNIWGYEWYDELPKDRFSSSFTKIIYYVYDTNKDGTDKNQLYRLHILMFHGNNENFDYVMDKRKNSNNQEISGTLYSYRYKKEIDYEKLKKDVEEIIKGNLKTDTKRIRPTNEK